MRTISNPLAAALAAAVVALAPTAAAAADAGYKLDSVEINVADKASLQSGARTYVNYCIGCHGLSLVRYSALRQIGLSDDLIRDNLMFTADKIGMPMTTPMSPADAKEWFGNPPPDLSVTARSRGADWLYTYLRTFYRDSSTATGWNNAVYPNVGMPHVLWQLQGQRALVHQEVMRDGKPVSDGHGGTVKTIKWEQVTPGAMSQLEYDRTIRDLVNFMAWAAEPHQLERRRIGVWVLFGTTVLIFLTYFLYKAFWKNVH